MSGTLETVIMPPDREVMVVVHPDDSQAFATSQIGFIDAFAGSLAILLLGSGGRPIQPDLWAPVARLLDRGLQVLTVSNGSFGNQRGLALPIDAAVAIMQTAGLQFGCDRLFVTGCRGGDRAGSAHMLADAFAALQFAVRVDPSVPDR